MKSHTQYRTFNTKRSQEIIHITPWVEEELAESGIQEGFCLVSAMHITASVFVNDNESGLHPMTTSTTAPARTTAPPTCAISPSVTRCSSR